MLPNPTIFLPGITATHLRDYYPLDPEMVWTLKKSITMKDMGRIIGHPNNPNLEAHQPSLILPDKIFEIAYSELIEELREDLPKENKVEARPVPVYAWGYDWRLPLSITSKQLGSFIDQVIQRTLLMRHYAEDGYAERQQVNLVGHSMGGLVIAGYLSGPKKDIQNAKTGQLKVDKIVTLAAPFQGSIEAVWQMTTGESSFGNQPRKRHAARVTPGLYHLLPNYKGAYEASWQGNEKPESLFDPKAWQPQTLKTLKQIIENYAVDSDSMNAADLFAQLLGDAQTFRKRINTKNLLDKIAFPRRNWLCVIGVDRPTRQRIKADQVIEKGGEETFIKFDLNASEEENSWGKDPDPATWLDTGDGTVPYHGAVPKFLDKKQLVLITPKNFGTFEWKDRILGQEALGGFHGILPNMNMLIRMVTHFLRTDPGDLHKISGQPAPDLANGAEDWDPPIPELKTELMQA